MQCVGSVLDLSETYYNPGALSLLKDHAIILSAKAFNFTNITIENGLAEGSDIDASRFNPAPSLLAGSINFGWLGSNKLAYSILYRHKFKVRLEARREDTRDVLVGAAGDELFSGEVQLNETLNETWAGLTWSREIFANVGLGVSQYLAIRSHRGQFHAFAEAVSSDEQFAVTRISDDYDYKNYRLLWKIGLAFDFSRLNLGVTVTTPDINLFGDGSVALNRTVIGQDVDGDGRKELQVTNDFQDDLSSHFNSPLSIAVGASYRWGSRTFYASAEWFNKVNQFDVLKTEQFEDSFSGEMQENAVTHELDEVINFAFGIQQDVGSKFALYASFSTDFSGSKDNSTTNLSMTNWDIYHIAGGCTFKIRESQFTVGLGRAFGSHDVERLIDFSGASERNRLLGTGSSGTEARYSELKLMVGLSFPF